MILTIEARDGQGIRKHYRTERQGLAAFYYYRRKAQAGGVESVYLMTDPIIDKSGPRWIYGGGKIIKQYTPPKPAEDEAEILKSILMTAYFKEGQGND